MKEKDVSSIHLLSLHFPFFHCSHVAQSEFREEARSARFGSLGLVEFVLILVGLELELNIVNCDRRIRRKSPFRPRRVGDFGLRVKSVAKTISNKWRGRKEKRKKRLKVRRRKQLRYLPYRKCGQLPRTNKEGEENYSLPAGRRRRKKGRKNIFATTERRFRQFPLNQ